MVTYLSLVLKFFSLGFVIAAGGFWAGAEVYSRPKYRDEQTLIGGAVWTQAIIPIGLIISTVINEELSVFVHAYFLFAGVLLLVATGLILIIGECKTMHRRRNSRRAITLPNIDGEPQTYNKIYFAIGTLSLLAGLITFADFIVILIYYNNSK